MEQVKWNKVWGKRKKKSNSFFLLLIEIPNDGLIVEDQKLRYWSTDWFILIFRILQRIKIRYWKSFSFLTNRHNLLTSSNITRNIKSLFQFSNSKSNSLMHRVDKQCQSLQIHNCNFINLYLNLPISAIYFLWQHHY